MEYDDSGRDNRRYGNTGPGITLNIVSAVGITLGFLLLLNRLYWRWKKGTPGLDDILIIFGWIFLLVLGIVSLKAVDFGYGRKQSKLTRTEASDAERLFYIYQIFYKLTINTSKLSILTLYLRVFDTKDWFGRLTKVLLFIVTAYTLSILMANIFICSPISLYWNTSPATTSSPSAASLRKSSCIDILAYWYASSLYNILSETLMLFSVLVRIWTLPSHSQPPILQFRQKVNLTIVLGLGVFTTITAILRMTTLGSTAMTSDKTGGTLTSTIWSSIEAGLGIVVANLPMVRQLLRWRGWCGGRWFSSTAGKSREHSRRRSSRGAGAGAGAGYQPASGRSPDNGNRNGSMHIAESGQQIHLQRDFERSVIITSGSSDDIEAQNSSYRHVEFQSPSGRLSLKPNTRSSSGTIRSKDESSGGSVKSISYAGFGTRTSSTAPSFTSTTAPTEPVPMVKISIEPSTISLPSTLVQPVVAAHLRKS